MSEDQCQKDFEAYRKERPECHGFDYGNAWRKGFERGQNKPVCAGPTDHVEHPAHSTADPVRTKSVTVRRTITESFDKVNPITLSPGWEFNHTTMTTLPTHLTQAAKQAAEAHRGQDTGDGQLDAMFSFKAGWAACHNHLLKSAPEFDEGAYNAEVDRLMRDGNIDHWGVFNWSKYFARWQHQQMAAQAAALRAELDSAYETLGTKAKEWATGELDRLRAEVERLKECEANFKLTAELQDAAIKDFNAILKLAEQMAGALEWIAAHTFGDVKLEASKHLAAWREYLTGERTLQKSVENKAKSNGGEK